MRDPRQRRRWHTAPGRRARDCNLVDNGGPGIDSLAPATGDVENNWWRRGRTHGTNGDGVSGPLDYTLWRTTPFVLLYVP